MKLLLDVHHSPVVAATLRDRGHDVLAAADDPVQRTLADDELLVAATEDGRAVVTENVADVLALARRGDDDRPHAGIVVATPTRFARATQAYPGSLVRSLEALLDDPPVDGAGWVWFLEPA